MSVNLNIAPVYQVEGVLDLYAEVLELFPLFCQCT